MTVKELMTRLEQMNPDLPVRFIMNQDENPIHDASDIADVYQISGSQGKRKDFNACIISGE